MLNISLYTYLFINLYKYFTVLFVSLLHPMQKFSLTIPSINVQDCSSVKIPIRFLLTISRKSPNLLFFTMSPLTHFYSPRSVVIFHSWWKWERSRFWLMLRYKLSRCDPASTMAFDIYLLSSRQLSLWIRLFSLYICLLSSC